MFPKNNPREGVQAVLKIRVFHSACTAVTDIPVNAVIKGIQVAGDDCSWTNNINEKCDVAFHTSGPKPLVATLLNDSRRALIASHGWKRLVLESPCFRHNLKSPGGAGSKWWRLSLGGFLDDEAMYHPQGFVADPSRWDVVRKEQDIKIRPWRRKGGHVLICGQKPHDSSLRGIDTHRWIRDVVKEVRAHTDRKIVVRLHPKDPNGSVKLNDLVGSTLSISNPGMRRKTLVSQDLVGAWAMVAYTSLSTIEAICDGVPAFAMDSGNFAWKVTGHDLSRIESPSTFDRDPWLWDLAYRQWTVDEHRGGGQWKRLREAYLKRMENELR